MTMPDPDDLYRYYHDDEEPASVVTPEPQQDFWREVHDVMTGDQGDKN